MSPRAAWRLETLGFEHVHDYVDGKADWFAHRLRREGTNATVPYADDLLDTEPPTCGLHEDLAAAASAIERSAYGFCLVVNDQHIVLGRLRRSALERTGDDATVASVMAPGPSTVRPNTPRASSSSASPTANCAPPSSRRPRGACSACSTASTRSTTSASADAVLRGRPARSPSGPHRLAPRAGARRMRLVPG